MRNHLCRFEFNSITLYHTAPISVTSMPVPFNTLTLTPNIRMPNKIVRHCFTFPHTVIVTALVFLFAENELMFNKNANAPFTARIRAVLRDGRGMDSKGRLKESQVEMKEDSSPLKVEKRRA